tara:strand:+ start:1032 stop:1535 length:504 start_codon:yes stop_codon:yes gene_type:complete
MENSHDEENVCCICCEDITENIHTLECGHTYHCGCIIKWFRNDHANCPLCNDITLSLKEIKKWGVKIKTIDEIKKLGKRKDCPQNIKKTLDKIKKIKEKEKIEIVKRKEIKVEFDIFKKNHTELIKSYMFFEKKSKYRFRYKNIRKIRELENELLAQIQITPIYLKK